MLCLSDSLREQGQAEEADALLRTLVGRNPESAQFLTDLGGSLSNNGQLGEAVGILQKAIALDPEFAEAHYFLGITLKQQSKLEQAIASFRKCDKFNPSAAEHHLALGNILFNDQGEYEEARIASSPLSPSILNCRKPALRSGQVLSCFKEIQEQAIPSFRQALELNSDNEVAYMNLGVALRLTGEFEGALDCFRKAIRLTPDNPEAYLNIGILEHEANGDTDAAIASLQKAIELDANSSLAHSSLAQVCLDADDIPRGILSYQKAMKLSPDDADLYNDAAWSLVTASGRDPRPDASSLAVEWAEDSRRAFAR